ncbi:MAG: hypothetical protein ACOCYU_07125 [Brevefilum sp.]
MGRANERWASPVNGFGRCHLSPGWGTGEASSALGRSATLAGLSPDDPDSLADGLLLLP